MIQNPIIFVLDNSGKTIVSQRGTVRALSNFASKVLVVAPFEGVSVKANYLIFDTKREVIGQFLAPTSLKGKDVLPANGVIFDVQSGQINASEFQVFEASISQRALHRIAKYRAGRIGISFQITSIQVPSQIVEGTGFQGLIDTTTQLTDPEDYAGDVGDYYVVDVYNISVQYVAGTLTKGDYVYFTGTAWLKGQNIKQIAMTSTVDLAVDPSLLAEIPDDFTATEDLTNFVNDLIGAVADLHTDVSAHIGNLEDPHNVQANQVQSDGDSDGDSDVQTDLDALDTRIDDIVAAETDITYDPAFRSIVNDTTVSGAISQLDSALDTHLTDFTNPHAVNSNQISATNDNSTITVQQYLEILDNEKVDKNPDTITSVSGTNKVYVNDGSDKVITIDNFRVSVFDNLVAFGFVIFSSKDDDGQPVVTNPLTNKIYLFDLDTQNPNNTFEEWVYLDNTFEKIGTTSIQLQDYDTTVVIDGKLDALQGILQTNIDGKANTVHTHVIADTTGLQNALDGKSVVGHGHIISDVTNLQTSLDAKLNLTGGTITGNLDVTGLINKPTANSVVLTQNGVPILSTFGTENTFVGRAGNTTTTGTGLNTAVGFNALLSNTSGNNNNAVGVNALTNNTSGNSNNAVGRSALLVNTTGISNNAVGRSALLGNTSGSGNNAVGRNAGRFIANGSTANATGNNSVFIGNDTKALANNQTNQIVIGHNATGNGSNTVTLGHTDITQTHLRGNVNMASAEVSGELTVQSIVIGGFRIIADTSSATLNFETV